MDALQALRDDISHGLVAAVAAAPLAWASALVAGLVALMALAALALLARRRRPPAGDDVDAVYLMSAAATRKAREIGEIDAFARRVNAASEELKLQIRRFRAGHHTQVRIYVDHSNFITSWNEVVHRGERALEHDVDWQVLPAVLLEQVEEWQRKMRRAPAAIVYRGMQVYGTLFEDGYFTLLETMLDLEQAAPSKLALPIRLRRETVERWRQENAAHKLELTHEIRNVAGCTVVPIFRRTPKKEQLMSAQYTSGGIPIAPEKTLDTRIATDLIGDAAFELYDAAILVTEDSDFIPAVEFVQEMRGKHVVHAGFGGHSNELRAVCRHRIDLGKGGLYRRMQRTRTDGAARKGSG
jgi:NYN domain